MSAVPSIMLPVNPLPVLQIPTGIGALLGCLALGAFIALVVGFILQRPEESAPTIDVTGDTPPRGAEKPTRLRA